MQTRRVKAIAIRELLQYNPDKPIKGWSDQKEREVAVKGQNWGDSLSPALSPIQCRDLGNACLANANRLISSSRVLLQANDTAGSLALLAVATHEMGRAVLVAFNMTVELTPASWRRFWFNFRSPRSGVRALLNWEQMAAQGPDCQYSSALTRLGELGGLHQRVSQMANYTNFSSAGPTLPERLLSRTMLDDAQAVTRARFLIASAGLPRFFDIFKPEYADLLAVCRASHAAFWDGEGRDVLDHVDRLCAYVESTASSVGSQSRGIA